MNEFRFENMRIWQDGMKHSQLLLEYATKAEEKKFYRYAEQLRAATMSITNDIAEGSGSDSDKDFARFLVMSKRSIYECVNILHLFEGSKIIRKEERENMYPSLAALSKQITNFRKSLLNGKRNT
jgi:four helix bundle protein